MIGAYVLPSSLPLCRVDDIVEFKGLSGKWKKFGLKYGGGVQCPACHGYGFRWAGWFMCDDRGDCVVWLDTEEVFVKEKPCMTSLEAVK